MKALLTAYCACAICCGRAGGLTASGEIPRAGLTIAAPRTVPFGTWVTIDIPGFGRLRRRVDDRMARSHSQRWDLYVSGHREAQMFGAKRCTITIHEKHP